MDSNSQHISILFLQNDKMNWIQANKQTQKIRELTNLKIRELGDKFYTVKRIFDRLRIKRDTLFFLGKTLENQYKYQKIGLHLQTQQWRMKESLICWYAQNFYTEILQPNSIILEKLLTCNNKTFYHYNKNANKKTQIKNKQFENFSIPINNNNEYPLENSQINQNVQISNCHNQNIEKIEIVQNIQNNYNNPQNTQNTGFLNQSIIGNTPLFNDIKINQEVDDFENGNIINHLKINDEPNLLSNFNFDHFNI